MGPGFMNLRFMCHCLARAIKRHLEFSKGSHWFLQDLQAIENDDELEFSYQLPPDLKLTINPKGVKVCTSDDDDDINPFQREETSGDFKEIDEQQINIDSKQVPSANPDMFGKLKQVENKNLREPEPEQTVFSDEEASGQKPGASATKGAKPGRFDNSVNNQKSEGADDIQEELDDGGDYSQDEFEEFEEKVIQQMRREEVRKSVFKKDEERLQTYLNQQKMNVLEQQVKMKDKQIEKLTKLVKDKNGVAVNVDVNSGILAMSPEADDEKDEEVFYDRGTKISRTEWLMAQVDLDPIESHGSMEMSTTKFKSIGGKRFINSDRGPIEDSQNS